MENQVLSIEQMKHLVNLGVSTDTASMCWIKNSDVSEEESKYILSVHNEWCYEMTCLRPIPTFTLQDIIEILPSPIKYKEVEYFLSIRKNAYGYGVSYHTGGHGSLTLMKCKSIIECAYQMLIWVIKNGYLSK